jgi:EAL domain-containing protein (putative c-di-GMP-specific phosphodiesterase class I)
MFEHVCRDIKNWLDAGYSVVPVSVNLSQLQLYNAGFIEEYKDIIDKYEISPEYVQLELTETTLFSKLSTMNEIIDNLHSLGFKILMDDFGTGYSSLNMLKNVKVDVLKLDKSFVDDIGETKGNIVVSSIVSLGQLLNMKIVAEGVETQEQFEFLRDIFCDEIQGYYFSKPIPKVEYEKLLTKGAL